MWTTGRGQLDTIPPGPECTGGVVLLCERLPVHQAAAAGGAVQPHLAGGPALCSPVSPPPLLRGIWC